MQIIGWVVGIWLIGSILVSLSVAFRAAPVMPPGYLGRMVIIQTIKGGIAYFIIRAVSG